MTEIGRAFKGLRALDPTKKPSKSLFQNRFPPLPLGIHRICEPQPIVVKKETEQETAISYKHVIFMRSLYHNICPGNQNDGLKELT